MVGVPYNMVTSQDGGYPMQFVSTSAFPQSSDGHMPYEFSQQDAYYMPMAQAAFVPVHMAHMTPQAAPASLDNQVAIANNNFQTEQSIGPANKSQYGNMRDQRLSVGKKQKELQGGKRQKDIKGVDVNDGPKAVLVDLSNLRP